MRFKGITGQAVAVCLVAAVAALFAFSVAGNVRAGAAVAIGLVLGSFNGALAERALGTGVTVRRSSIPRLAILSAAAIGAGLLIGGSYVWLLILGVAGAQLVLVAVAARSLFDR